MARVCYLLMLAVLTPAKEQQRNPYDSQRPLSPSDAARRFDLTSEGLFGLRTLVCALSEDDAQTGMVLMCRRRSDNEQRCYDQQQFSGVEVEMLKSIDDQLRNGEKSQTQLAEARFAEVLQALLKISRVASRDPSTLSQNDKEMFRNRIYRAIMRIAPDEQMALMMRQKLENFVKCMATSYRRSYSGGRDRRE